MTQSDLLPFVATLKESGGWRFLIDQIDGDMWSGFKIDTHGSIGDGISKTTGSGGRLNYHKSHFERTPTASDDAVAGLPTSEQICIAFDEWFKALPDSLDIDDAGALHGWMACYRWFRAHLTDKKGA